MSGRIDRRWLAAPWKAKGPHVGAVSCRCLFGTDRWGLLLHFVDLHQSFDGLGLGGISAYLLGARLGGVGLGGLGGLNFVHRV